MSRGVAVSSRALEVTAYFRSLINERVASKDSLRKIGDEFGVSHVHVKSIRDGGGRVGADLEETIARKFFGGRVDDLRATAKKFAEEHPEALESATVVEPLARYPNAEIAAEFARRDGISEQAIVAVLAGRHSLATDAATGDWLRAMEREDRSLPQAAPDTSSAMDAAAKAGKPKLPKRKR